MEKEMMNDIGKQKANNFFIIYEAKPAITVKYHKTSNYS